MCWVAHPTRIGSPRIPERSSSRCTRPQYKKYVSAAYEDGSANKNEVDAKTSGEIVDALTAAWKDLRFTSATTGNDLLDSNNNAEHQSGRTQVIYRLSQGSSKHLYTADPKEQPVLLANGWSKDGGESSFFVPAQYTTSTKGVVCTAPLVTPTCTPLIRTRSWSWPVRTGSWSLTASSSTDCDIAHRPCDIRRIG